MSDDLDEGLSWILVDPRVTSSGASSSPECLTLSISLLRDIGATNEIKTLASLPSAPEKEIPASVKIYVEDGSNLIPFMNVFKSLLVDLINRRSRRTADIDTGWSEDIEITHGKSHRNRLTSKSGYIEKKEMWMMFLFPFRACE